MTYVKAEAGLGTVSDFASWAAGRTVFGFAVKRMSRLATFWVSTTCLWVEIVKAKDVTDRSRRCWLAAMELRLLQLLERNLTQVLRWQLDLAWYCCYV